MAWLSVWENGTQTIDRRKINLSPIRPIKRWEEACRAILASGLGRPMLTGEAARMWDGDAIFIGGSSGALPKDGVILGGGKLEHVVIATPKQFIALGRRLALRSRIESARKSKRKTIESSTVALWRFRRCQI